MQEINKLKDFNFHKQYLERFIIYLLGSHFIANLLVLLYCNFNFIYISNFRNILYPITLIVILFFNNYTTKKYPKYLFIILHIIALAFINLRTDLMGIADPFYLLLIGLVILLFPSKEKKFGYFLLQIVLLVWVVLLFSKSNLPWIEKSTFILFETDVFRIAVKIYFIISGFSIYYNFMSLHNRYTNQIKRSEKSVKIELEKKTNFLNSMSHDIRTPLNGLNGLTYLLQSSKPNKYQEELLNKLKTSTDLLLNNLNNNLEFSKYQGNIVALEETNVNLPSLFLSLKEKYKNECVKNDLKFSIAINQDAYYVKLDQQKLLQIVEIILLNAIKHTQNGEVSLSLEIENDFKDSITYTVNITDTGKGFSKKTVNAINNPKQYLLLLLESENKLGLNILTAIEILKLMNTNLILKSTIGNGSSFSFSLNVLKTL